MYGIIIKKGSGDGAQLINCAPFGSWEKASEYASALKEMHRTRYDVISLWEACTNKASCGGRPAMKAEIHRLLKWYGVVFYLARYGEGEDHNPHGQWGLCRASELAEKLEGAERVVTGYTLNHCFHKLGGGCANRGAKIYWSW